jgi:hypothetical protein
MENPELIPASKGIEMGPYFHTGPKLLVEIAFIQNGCGLYLEPAYISD